MTAAIENEDRGDNKNPCPTCKHPMDIHYSGALKALEEPTGCGGIVEWGSIGSVGDLQGVIGLLT